MAALLHYFILAAILEYTILLAWNPFTEQLNCSNSNGPNAVAVCSECSALARQECINSSVTLWALFQTNTTADTSWTRKGNIPGVSSPGQLRSYNKTSNIYNTSYSFNINSSREFGYYELHVAGLSVCTFELQSGFCCEQQPHSQVLNINTSRSTIFIPHLSINVSINCMVQGSRLNSGVGWNVTNTNQSESISIDNIKQPTGYYTRSYYSKDRCAFNNTLIINSPTINDSGNYTCYLGENHTASISLKIIDLPQFQEVSTEKCDYKSTEDIEVKFRITGEYIVPVPQVTDNTTEALINSNKYKFEYLTDMFGISVRLLIHNNSLDPGVYTSQVCIYYNSTVSDCYAEIYNHTPICNGTQFTVYNDQSALIGSCIGAGAVIIVMVIFTVTSVLTLYQKKCRQKQTLSYQYISELSETATSRVFYEGTESDAPIFSTGVTKKVIIVYGDNFADVEDFCDILDCFSGGCGPRPAFKCDCDIRHKSEVSGTNWNSWTVEKIKKADIVLLVCSEKLCASLSQSTNPPPIETAVGQISASAITNLCSIISSTTGKFIPIFVNQPINKDIIPASLADRKAYQVNTTRFMTIECQHVNEEDWRWAVGQYLLEVEAQDFVDLLKCVRDRDY